MMMLRLVLTILLYAVPSWAQVTPVDPTEPTAFTPSFAASALSTVNVTSGDGADLKAKIEAITTCGADVVVPVASGYAPSTTITLPAVAGSCVGAAAGRGAIAGTSGAKIVSGTGGLSGGAVTGGDDYITIRSANSGSLPAYGTVVSAGDQANMPTITAPNGSFLFKCQTGSHHIRLVGLNMVANSSQYVDTFVQCTSLTVGTDVHDIVIDRNYMTADATGGAAQGVQIGGANIQVVGNRITKINDNVGSAETHGVLIQTGSGPYSVKRNEVCAQGINLFIGESQVALWSGGSYGVGSPVIPSNGTVTNNWFHKLCVDAAKRSPEKNLQEIKHGQYWKFDGNIYDTSYAAGQQLCIQLVSYRGSQSAATDISFTNNWVKNCAQGMSITFRPTEAIQITGVISDGTTNCSGGGCARLTLVGPCDCTTGDTVEIANVNGTTEVNGTTTRITRVDSTHVTTTVPFVNTYVQAGVCAFRGNVDCGTALFFFQARPLQRVKITNNLFMDMAAAAQSNSTRWTFLNMNTNPTVTPSGGTDAGISATGDWDPKDFNFSHNTIVSPTAGDLIRNFIVMLGPGFNNPYTQWAGTNWAIRDNVIKITDGSSGVYAAYFDYAQGGGTVYGTTALNNMTDSATRDFSHNLGFSSAMADESTKYTGSDSWLSSGTGNCATLAVLVDCTATTVAGAALQASSPGHNASSDAVPVDVGADMTALAAAIANVPQ